MPDVEVVLYIRTFDFKCVLFQLFFVFITLKCILNLYFVFISFCMVDLDFLNTILHVTL